MSENILRFAQRCALALLLTSGLCALPAKAAVLSFNPATTSTAVGATTSVDVRIGGLGGTLDLAAFDLNVLFDASKLSFSSYTLGGSLGDTTLLEAFDFSAGKLAVGVLNLAEVSFLSDLGAQTDGFVLATLNFTALRHGVSTLSFGAVTLSDAFGDPLTASATSAAVSAIPEPGSAYLVLTAFILLGLMRRARK
ncbi:MAG: cohesin domain-containing protein [Massilia sp.]